MKQFMHIVVRLKLKIMVQVIMGRFVGDPFFRPFVFPNKWSLKDVRGMFHCLAAKWSQAHHHRMHPTPIVNLHQSNYMFFCYNLLQIQMYGSTWGISILVIS
jgi:hypothetical protein